MPRRIHAGSDRCERVPPAPNLPRAATEPFVVSVASHGTVRQQRGVFSTLAFADPLRRSLPAAIFGYGGLPSLAPKSEEEKSRAKRNPGPQQGFSDCWGREAGRPPKGDKRSRRPC